MIELRLEVEIVWWVLFKGESVMRGSPWSRGLGGWYRRQSPTWLYAGGGVARRAFGNRAGLCVLVSVWAEGCASATRLQNRKLQTNANM